MIDPPQVRPEEPTAVTPHGGIRGGESQQWLSYPTKPRVGFVRGRLAMGVPTAIATSAQASRASVDPGTRLVPGRAERGPVGRA